MVPIRRLLSLSCCIYLLVAGGCATRYQDLLRDRDAEIRDLESKLAGARAESEDLRRQKEEAERRASESARPADATATGSDAQLARVQDALPDLDVRRKFGRISIGIENTDSFSALVRYTEPGRELPIATHDVLEQTILDEDNQLVSRIGQVRCFLQVLQLGHELQMFFSMLLRSRVAIVAHGTFLVGKMQPGKVFKLAQDRLYCGSCRSLGDGILYQRDAVQKDPVLLVYPGKADAILICPCHISLHCRCFGAVPLSIGDRDAAVWRWGAGKVRR